MNNISMVDNVQDIQQILEKVGKQKYKNRKVIYIFFVKIINIYT